MNKRDFLLGLILLIFFISNISALTQPSIFYPNATGIRIDNGTNINWSASTGSGEIIKYNLFYSNDSGTNWYDIVLNWGYVNSLNNSNTEENITFSGNENLTIYIDVPKYANITSAILNLTGYQIITSPYTKVYDSLIDEPESDGSTESAYQAIGFGRILTNYPGINMYFIINNTPNLNADKVEILLAGSGSNPENDNIIYHINIAETNDFLTGNPIDDNTTAYTRVKSNFPCSQEWGTDNNVYKNITFDTTYLLNSSKMYILWFEYVSGSTHGSQYSLNFDTNAGITNNYTGVINGLSDISYPRIPGINFYNGTVGDISNAWLEVGDEDGNYEWNQTGNFATTNQTNDFNNSLQSYLDDNCTSNLWENCSVPFKLHSDTIGKIRISDINIQFTDYWWNTTNLNELTTYLINITPTNSTTNETSIISGNDFTISHDSPNTTLNLPTSDYSNSTSDPVNVDFNCSATDDYNLANISLYITDNSNSSFSLNQTTNIFGISNFTNWTLSLSNGDYTWNCLAYDSVGNSDWAENRSILINYVVPVTPLPSGGGSNGGGTTTKKEKIEFDVKIIKIDSPAEPKQFYNFTYYVKGVGDINSDVILDFWIEKNNIKITSGSDVIYFGNSEEKTETTQLFLPSKTLDDTYNFYVQASYKNYSAKAHRSLEVIYSEREFEEEKFQEIYSEKPSFWKNLWNKIKSGFFFIFQYLKNNKIYLIFGLGSLILLIIFILITLFVIRKFKKETKPNRLKSTIKLKVYSADGNRVGKIKEVYINKNRIDSWLIKVNKKIKKKIRKKQVLIKHKDVDSIGNIMIIDKRIDGFLNK